MARSLSKLLAVSVADALSLSVFRRGYAGAAPRSVAASARFGSGGSRGGSMVGKGEERAMNMIKEDSEAYTAWAPDPTTGYYRPANCAHEIDPAELREMLLSHRVRPQ